MRRLFPHPYLTLTLTGMWFLLVNEWKLGSLVMALILGTILPLVTSAWWPDRPRIRRPLALAAYAALVLWDVILANFQVARIVLFLPRDRISRPGSPSPSPSPSPRRSASSPGPSP